MILSRPQLIPAAAGEPVPWVVGVARVAPALMAAEVSWPMTWRSITSAGHASALPLPLPADCRLLFVCEITISPGVPSGPRPDAACSGPDAVPRKLNETSWKPGGAYVPGSTFVEAAMSAIGVPLFCCQTSEAWHSPSAGVAPAATSNACAPNRGVRVKSGASDTHHASAFFTRACTEYSTLPPPTSRRVKVPVTVVPSDGLPIETR